MQNLNFKRGNMLNFVAGKFLIENEINSKKVFTTSKAQIVKGDLIYLMRRDYRIYDNDGFSYAKKMSEKLGKKMRVLIHFDEKYYSKVQENFFKEVLDGVIDGLEANKIEFSLVKNYDNIKNAGMVICDFNPIKPPIMASCSVVEVDCHNIIPARFISDKQEYSAATFRRKVYGKIYEFLSEPSNEGEQLPKYKEALDVLNEFILNKLNFYAELKNNPNVNATSNLSVYLNFGVISSKKVAVEVLKSEASAQNKEAFLEELIVRKELADNFCLYNKNFKSLLGAPLWARESLAEHKCDFRNHVYLKSEFEKAQTHEPLWNAIQNKLVLKHKIEGYLRMYWAKKILEWSKTPKEALETAIYLNDKYSLDGNCPNGYVGILWSIAGLHDRAFQNRCITGKIRQMTLNGCRGKFDVGKYISL